MPSFLNRASPAAMPAGKHTTRRTKSMPQFHSRILTLGFAFTLATAYILLTLILSPQEPASHALADDNAQETARRQVLSAKQQAEKQKFADIESRFRKSVQPLLKKYCFRCHNVDKVTSGVRVDHLDGKLFVDYLSPLKRQRIKKKIEKMQKADIM